MPFLQFRMGVIAKLAPRSDCAREMPAGSPIALARVIVPMHTELRGKWKVKSMHNKLVGLIFAGILSSSVGLAADVFVKIAPPRVVVEKRGSAPGRDYVWINGYHRWEHRKGGYVFVEGHWR